jgi:predicted nucleic acid-binding Zn ribbon protein
VQSQGSIEFSKHPRSGVEWASLLGVTTASASRWKAGLVRPSAKLRQLIHANGGPDPKTWDQVVGAAAPTKRKLKTKKKRVKATAAAVIDEADLWLAELQDFRNELPTLVSDAKGRASLLANVAKTLLVLGKITGVGLNISPRQILDSPNWRLIEAKIIQALRPWPDALRAVAKALDESRDD